MTKKQKPQEAPRCEICEAPAVCEAKTKMGHWAILCPLCLLHFGLGRTKTNKTVEKTNNES
jgi:hypothetical protein